MSEVVAGPDAEAVVATHLASVLTDVYVATRVPNPRPSGKLVKVTQIGGQRRTLPAFSSMVTLECWADDDVAASELCRLAYAHLWALPGQSVGDVWVYRCVDVAGPAYYPDPDSTTPRYQCTVQLDLRGSALT